MTITIIIMTIEQCDLPMRRGGISVIGNCCLQPIPVSSTFPCCSLYVPDSTSEDLRDWQTLIRDFEIGATRCQTSLAHSDSLSQFSRGVGWWWWGAEASVAEDKIFYWSLGAAPFSPPPPPHGLQLNWYVWCLMLSRTKAPGFSTFDLELVNPPGWAATDT